MKKELELNLEKDILEGFESFYDSMNVAVLRIANNLGHQFPAVDIVSEEGVYRIVFGRGRDFNNYGGHSRAISALQDKYPLKCNLLEAHNLNPQEHKVIYKPISQIPPKRITTIDSLSRLNGNLEFLPKKLRDKFIKDNNLILSNEVLYDLEDYLNPPPF